MYKKQNQNSPHVLQTRILSIFVLRCCSDWSVSQFLDMFSTADMYQRMLSFVSTMLTLSVICHCIWRKPEERPKKLPSAWIRNCSRSFANQSILSRLDLRLGGNWTQKYCLSHVATETSQRSFNSICLAVSKNLFDRPAEAHIWAKKHADFLSCGALSLYPMLRLHNLDNIVPTWQMNREDSNFIVIRFVH